MFIIAAEAVAEQVTQDDFVKGLIYPLVKDIMKVSLNVALKIEEEIFKSGLSGIERPDDLRVFIKNKMYAPAYK